jgi:hypothetical protein
VDVTWAVPLTGAFTIEQTRTSMTWGVWGYGGNAMVQVKVGDSWEFLSPERSRDSQPIMANPTFEDYFATTESVTGLRLKTPTWTTTGATGSIKVCGHPQGVVPKCAEGKAGLECGQPCQPAIRTDDHSFAPAGCSVERESYRSNHQLIPIQPVWYSARRAHNTHKLIQTQTLTQRTTDTHKNTHHTHKLHTGTRIQRETAPTQSTNWSAVERCTRRV